MGTLLLAVDEDFYIVLLYGPQDVAQRQGSVLIDSSAENRVDKILILFSPLSPFIIPFSVQFLVFHTAMRPQKDLNKQLKNRIG